MQAVSRRSSSVVEFGVLQDIDEEHTFRGGNAMVGRCRLILSNPR
jgi:hypothetical protein